MYQLSFMVEDVDRAAAELRQAGLTVIKAVHVAELRVVEELPERGVLVGREVAGGLLPQDAEEPDGLPRLIDVTIYQSVLDSIASEQSARMVAMRNATDNATDLITELQLASNKARQSRITKEMLEIATGAEALASAVEGAGMAHRADDAAQPQASPERPSAAGILSRIDTTVRVSPIARLPRRYFGNTSRSVPHPWLRRLQLELRVAGHRDHPALRPIIRHEAMCPDIFLHERGEARHRRQRDIRP